MPRSSQIAALEDRVQQLEKLLTAQALLMGPLLAGNDHSIPLRPTITVREASDDEEIIRVVTRSIDMGVGDQTPAALSAFYLDIGRRLLSGDRQQSTQSITCSTPQTFDQGEKRMANIDDKSSPRFAQSCLNVPASASELMGNSDSPTDRPFQLFLSNGRQTLLPSDVFVIP
jgi:hypothetical protein